MAKKSNTLLGFITKRFSEHKKTKQSTKPRKLNQEELDKKWAELLSKLPKCPSCGEPLHFGSAGYACSNIDKCALAGVWVKTDFWNFVIDLKTKLDKQKQTNKKLGMIISRMKRKS